MTRPAAGIISAATLLLVAGFVDAIAFIYLQANFVSFMSGNPTVMGVSPSLGHWSDVGICAGLIALFFAGVFVGSVINRTRRRPREWLLWTVTGTMALGATVAGLQPDSSGQGIAGAGVTGMLVVAVATGMINAIFERDAAVPYGLTYVTGTLVRSARQLADTVVTRGDHTDAPRRAWLKSLGMWSLLAVGAVGGGYGFRWLTLSALWIPVVALLVMALTTALARVVNRAG